jgi:uncharacterized protein YprB with RNaseH-like and TPR domain
MNARDEIRRSLRKRVSSARAPASAPREAAQPIVYPRELPRRPAPSASLVAGRPVALDDALARLSADVREDGGAYVIERRLEDEGYRGSSFAVASAVADGRSGLCEQLRRAGLDAGKPRPPRPEDLLFLDLETTGLTSCPVFLLGAMVWDAGGLVARQFFARDYSQEAAAVRAFLDLARYRRVLVSFNGKSFDVPFVRARAAANGLACRLNQPHVDLLHTARRTWGPRVGGPLPDCRLQTLERVLCGRIRDDDIPGHLIPDAYHAFVHTGNAARIVEIIRHNFLDLVTMADIVARLPAGG